ncbi:hypothetical protein HIM_09369 [Hirsutella minnesotensis 3608]|uniref:Major facilitator superfamily (MFS) profile domain-containing protein n=1 Tax=Hirsutella minnesotensis 3608 TaxID=1043627 RepID=A0A0F7ZGP0_9HYPO|nr:hypothetical protein HIM_09369 [Hirsutella minnesotensis 3608]
MPQPKAAPRRSRPGLGAAERTLSSGSFHAGAPIPTLPILRRASTYRYQTFPTQPPKTPGDQQPLAHARQASASSLLSRSSPPPPDASSSESTDDEHADETPLPVRQLLLLAFLSLSEQTALNSISPYLPRMVASMPGIPDGQSGLYVGIVASSFALAQLATNFLWGYASDVVGRKPVLLAGTTALMACFCLFGLCRQFWHIIVVHVAMGLLNGNAACVPTVLGELTDRSNQGRAFTYLPVIYGLGAITGPAVGGLLVGRLAGDRYPYLAPNLLAALMLLVNVVVMAIFFRETLDGAGVGDWRPEWFRRFCTWLRSRSLRRPPLRRNTWSSRWPRARARHRQPLMSSSSGETSSDHDSGDDAAPDGELGDHEAGKAALPDHGQAVWRDLRNSTTMTLLATYLIFQLSNISFNSLYPIFAAAPAPTGRDLGPETIGVSLSLAGVATIIFQAFLYQPLRARTGNLGTYRFALLGIAISMVLVPWVGYVDDDPLLGVGSGRLWLYIQLGIVLILRNMCAVGGLSSVMLLITNSAPAHARLGAIQGVAQTLSALGRSVGPFASGALFTLSTNIRPKGEALAWSIFGGLALVGWIGSLFIRGRGLESDDWEDEERGDQEAGHGDDDV